VTKRHVGWSGAIARPGAPHVAARARQQLAAGRLAAVESLGDGGVVDLEHVVQQQHRALQRRQPLERQQEGDRDLLGALDRIGGQRLDQGIGQPGSAIGLAPDALGAELVDAEPGGDAHEPGRGIGEVFGRGAPPTQPRLLDDVLGVGELAQHPIGEPLQPRTLALENLVGRCHAAAANGRAWGAASPATTTRAQVRP